MVENLPSTGFFYLVHTDDRKTYCFNGCDIPKGQLKLKEYMGSFYGHVEYRHFCLRCAVERLDKEMQGMAFMMATIGKCLNPDRVLSENIKTTGGGNNARRGRRNDQDGN